MPSSGTKETMSQLKTMVTARRRGEAVGMEEKDHAGEGEQVEGRAPPQPDNRSAALAHHLAIVAWQSHSELPAIGWRQIGGQQHQQPAQAAEEEVP